MVDPQLLCSNTLTVNVNNFRVCGQADVTLRANSGCTRMKMTPGPHQAAVTDADTSATEDIMILSSGLHANRIAGI